MAAKCRDIIRRSNEVEESLPNALHPKHLIWMCDQIQNNPQGWPVTRLHRWIGFLQAAILANRMLNLEEIRGIFDEVKKSHKVISGDQDLTDHLDVSSSFKLDLGGQG